MPAPSLGDIDRYPPNREDFGEFEDDASHGGHIATAVSITPIWAWPS